MGNAQFTEEARAEAYRVESMQQLMRQTKAVESIKTYVGIWFWVTLVGLVFMLVALASADGRF